MTPLRQSLPCEIFSASATISSLRVRDSSSRLARSSRRCPRCRPISGPSASSRARQPDDVADRVGLDELGRDLLDRLGRLVRAEGAGAHPLLEQLDLERERVEAPGEERERLLGRALGVLADRALAVSRAHVDGAVGVDPAPLARQLAGLSALADGLALAVPVGGVALRGHVATPASALSGCCGSASPSSYACRR